MVLGFSIKVWDIITSWTRARVCCSERFWGGKAMCWWNKWKKELLRLEEIVDEISETSLEQVNSSRNYVKALNLAIAFLKSPKVTICTSAISALNKQVCNLLLHPDRRVKLKAFECYGLISLLDVKSATYVMNMLSMMVRYFF